MRSATLVRPLRRPPALILAALVTLAACSGDDGGTGPGPDPEPTVGISPSTLSLIVGDTASVSATVTGSAAAPTFSSSDASVVSVTPTGKLAAAGVGTATITASVGSASASATVTVGAANPTLDIVAITQDGQPVDPESVSGVIDVDVEYDGFPNTASGVIEVTIDDVVVGSATFPAGAAATARAAGGGGAASVSGLRGSTRVEAVTNAIDVVDADAFAALTVDGLADVLARVPGVVTSSPQQVALNNGNQVFLRGLGSARTLELVDGTYRAGDIDAEVGYVDRDGRTITGITVDLDGIGEQVFPTLVRPATRVGDTNRWSVSLTASITEGLETEVSFTNAHITYADATTETVPIYAGVAFHPDWPSTSFHVDQVAGTPNTTGWALSNPWVGGGVDEVAALALAGVVTGGENPTYVDRGAGGLSAKLFWGPSYGDWTRYTNSDAIAGTSGRTNVFGIEWGDAIGNTRFEALYGPDAAPLNWGRDTFVPLLTRSTGDGFLGRRTDNPVGLTLGWTASDVGSGLSGIYSGRIVRRAPGLPDAGECVFGDDPDCTYKPLEIGERKWDVTAVSAALGYYSAQVRESDLTGQWSDALRVSWTQGGADPTIANYTAPTSVTGGQLTEWGGTAEDDFTLLSALWSLGYSGWNTKIARRLPLSAPFDNEWTTSATLSESLHTYASFEETDADGFLNGVKHPLAALEWTVTDGSRLRAAVSQSVEGNVTGLSLQSFYDRSADLFAVSGTSSIEYNEDGTPNPKSVGTYNVEAWTRDKNAYTLSDVRLALAATASTGERLIYPIGEPLERTFQDNGGWFQVFYQTVIDFAALNAMQELHHMKIDGFTAIGSDSDGNAVLARIRSLTLTKIRTPPPAEH